MLRLALLAALTFGFTEGDPSGDYPYGAASHNGHEASVNKNNAFRQLDVNKVANHVGSGSGTAFLDGVPGTYLGRTSHAQYSHGSGYGNGYGTEYGNGYGKSHGNSYGKGHGKGYGNGYSNSYGTGHGKGYGKGYGNSYGNGHSNSYGNGHGNGYGNSYGNSYGNNGYGNG